MYWNELNPREREIRFKFDGCDLDSENDKKQTRTLVDSVLSFIQLFFSSSNMHGFRLIWATAICMSIYGSMILGLSTWNRYQENPTVISMDRNYHEWPTMLPAMTICPFHKINDTKVDELIQNEFPQYNDTEKYGIRSFLVSLANATYGTFKDVPVDDRIPPEKYLSYVHAMRVTLDYTVTNNLNEEISSVGMVLTTTESGFCYSFNGDISPYNNYRYWMENNKTILPGIEVASGSPKDGDRSLQVTVMEMGYTGFLHSPYEPPDVADRTYVTPADHLKVIVTTALSINSDPEIEYLSVRQRGCRFLKDSTLDISPVYTYHMCRIQCRMDQAKKLCGCVPYFYRPIEKYRICDVNGMYCLDQHKEFLIKLRNVSGDNAKASCGCYPPCDDVSYTVKSEYTMEADVWSVTSPVGSSPIGTSVRWGFVKYPKMRLKRNILFGFTDVLVSIGGNAGLFLGCSVLSFLEIIYFFTFRLVFFAKNISTM